MQQYTSIDDIAIENAWLTIGVFDGVHVGHQQVIRELVVGAKKASLPSVVLTFHPHPAVVLGGKTDFKMLNTPAEQADILAALGVEYLINQPFTRALADQTAEEFMERVSRHLGLRTLVIGYDTALGRGRQGNAARLAEIGLELGYAVISVPPISDERGIISSTRIRQEVTAGEVDSAAQDLGRYFFVSGPVVHGDGRGHTLNLPTANIQAPPGKLIPSNGIYACWAWVDGQRYLAAVNVGVRPTFTPDLPAPAVEAYILDFDRDIYGTEVKVEFVSYLRPEEKYATITDLLNQIRNDIEITKKILNKIVDQ
jgi:riboflavin kinase / FMN adenylyltransferase